MIEWKQNDNNLWFNTCNKSCMECERFIWEKCNYSCVQQKGWDCEECIYSKNGTVANRGKCEHCTVDSKNLQGKPSQYREKDK